MNTKNSKYLFAFFLLVSVIMLACNGGGKITPTLAEPTNINDDTGSQPSIEILEPTPENPILIDDTYLNTDPSGQEVTFWHPYTGENENALIKIIEDFNATNPWNIYVIPEYQGNHDDIFDKMLTFMNTVDVPNLVVAYQNQAATYQLGKALIDIDELVYSEKWGLSQEEIDDFFPGFFYQDTFPSFNNMRLGFPPNRSMEVLYYNQDWLTELGYDAPPATPEEFNEMACAAAAQPFSGATAEGSIGYQMSANASQFASFTFAFDGDIFDYNNNQYTYDRPEAVDAMAFIQRLFNDECANLVTEHNGDQIEFSQGTTLFTIGSSSSLQDYHSAVQAGSKHNWSVAPIPHVTEEPIQNIYGASISIPKTSPESQLAAWLFLKFFTSPEIQANWAMNSSYFPVRASTAGSLGDYLANHPAYAEAFKLLPYGTSEPPVAGYDYVRDMVSESMFAISQGADVINVLTKLNADANSNLAEQMAVIPEPPDPWTEIDPSGQTIIFWHQQPPARHNTLNELIWKFNSTNKWGITVITEYQDDTSDKMQQAINSSDTPNLVEIFQIQAADFQLAGVFSDMTSLVESIKWGLSPQEQIDFYSGIYSQDIYPTFQNTRLGFPPHRSMFVMYYNADWLAELKAVGAIDFDGPPQNPEQFEAAACAAVVNPFSRSLTENSMGYQLNINASSFANWTFAHGGDVFDYENAQYSYNNEAAVAAMTYLQDLFNQDCTGLIVERYGDQIDFSQGALLFTVGSTSSLPFYQSDVIEIGPFNWSVASLPHSPVEPVQYVYGSSLSIPKGTSESELAAWLFIKYFVSPEVQAQWVQASNYLPVRASVAGGLGDYFATNPAYATSFEMLQYAITEPSIPGYYFVSGMVEEAMVAIIADGADVQSTLDQLTEDANINLAEQLEQ